MEQYLDQVNTILEFGSWTGNRTGYKTIEIFGMQEHYYDS